MKPEKPIRKTVLPTEEFDDVKRIALSYLKTHEWISNRVIRTITKISYDQAIWFFGQMTKSGELRREGKGSSTRYVLVDQASRQP